jgi:hypothetical protein
MNHAEQLRKFATTGTMTDAQRKGLRAAAAKMDNYSALLRECLSDYGHPNFTDRHGMADRLRAALKE